MMQINKTTYSFVLPAPRLRERTRRVKTIKTNKPIKRKRFVLKQTTQTQTQKSNTLLCRRAARSCAVWGWSQYVVRNDLYIDATRNSIDCRLDRRTFSGVARTSFGPVRRKRVMMIIHSTKTKFQKKKKEKKKNRNGRPRFRDDEATQNRQIVPAVVAVDVPRDAER